MFRHAVTQHYRSKGYEVHEGARLETENGLVVLDLVAESPLGTLLVSFGDAGGIDAPELGRVKKIAKDMGATPVLAAPTVEPELRRLATQMGVVVLDGTFQTGGPDPPIPAATAATPWPGLATPSVRADDALAAHPWPASGRAHPIHKGAMHQVEVGEVIQTYAPTPEPTAAQRIKVPGLWKTGVPASPSASGTVTATSGAPAGIPPPKFAWLGATPRPTQTNEPLASTESTVTATEAQRRMQVELGIDWGRVVKWTLIGSAVAGIIAVLWKYGYLHT